MKSIDGRVVKFMEIKKTHVNCIDSYSRVVHGVCKSRAVPARIHFASVSSTSMRRFVSNTRFLMVLFGQAYTGHLYIISALMPAPAQAAWNN